MSLSVDTAFNCNNIPSGIFLQDIQGDTSEAGTPTIEIGIFTHESQPNNDYLMLVNRRCSRDNNGTCAFPQNVTVVTNKSTAHQLKDLVNGEIFVSSSGTFKDIPINAGEGRLFELRSLFSQNETWSNNVYFSSDITVPTGKILTIDSGSNLIFHANYDSKYSGRNIYLSELTILGKLEADGAMFNSTAEYSDTWYGVVLDDADDNSFIKNCTFKYGRIGILCLDGSDINIEGNTFQYCDDQAIWLHYSDPYIHENLIEQGNRYGIYMSYSFPYIYNNKIQDNPHYGVFYNWSSGGYLRHNTIKDNIGGVRCASSSSPNLIGKSSSESFGANKIIDNGLGGSWWGVCPSDNGNPNLGTTNDSTNYAAGRNSLYDNTSWQVKNLSSNAIYARRNYWKSYPPYNYGTVYHVGPTYGELSNVGALWKKQGNEEKILEYLAKGQELEGQGSFDEAVENYRWVIDNYPESEYSDFAFARLKSCRAQQGNEDLEDKYTADLVTQYSDKRIGESAILWLPVIAAKQGRKSEAVSMSSNWMDSKANTELEKDLLFQLAMIYYYEFQDYKAARETMDTFLEKFPDDIRSFDIKNLDFLFDYTPDLPKQDPGTSEKPEQVIDNFVLEQNYPNPFNPETEISFQLPEDVHVKLSIFNMLGQKVRTLIVKQMATGYHTIKWDGRNDFGNNVTSGVYLYVIQAGEFFDVKKMVLMQ